MAMDQRNICDPIMLGLFRDELAGQTRLLESGFAEIEQGLSLEQINDLIRAVHAIKGAARVVGLPVAVSLAYAMEEFLCEVRLTKCQLLPAHTDQLLQATEIFHAIRDQEGKNIPHWIGEQEESIRCVTQALWKFLAETEEPPFAVVPETTIPEGEMPVQAETSQDASSEEVTAGIPEMTSITDDESPFPEKTEEVIPESETPEELDVQPVAAEPDASVVISEMINVPERDSPVQEPQGDVPHERILNRDNLIELAGECLIQARRIRDLHPALQALAYHAPAAGMPIAMTDSLKDGGPSVDPERTPVADPVLLFDRSSQRLEHLTGQVYDQILASRTAPFADMIRDYPLRINDLAEKLGKGVKFWTEGESTPVIREIMAKLQEPLWELIRFALFYSLETPAEREAAGKSPDGFLSLEIWQNSEMLHLTLTDDGRGIGAEKPIEDTIAHGASASSEAEIAFVAVCSAIKALHGTIRLEPCPGGETKFALVFPAISSISRCLVVRIGGETYALPIMHIDQVVKVSPGSLLSIADRPFVSIEGENIGLVDAGQIFNLPALSYSTGDLPVVVLGNGQNRYGIIVEAFLGEENLLLRPLDGRLGKVDYIRSGAILGDGSPTLVLDMDDLFPAVALMAGQGRLPKVAPPTKTAPFTPEKGLPSERMPSPFWRW
jgi:two-component system sensor histidine kinase and response regulator WspE